MFGVDDNKIYYLSVDHAYPERKTNQLLTIKIRKLKAN